MHNMATLPPQDITMLSYRIEGIEKEVQRLSTQLGNYVPQRENDLKLQSIQDTTKRIEGEVADAKKQLIEMNAKLIAQATDVQKRDAEQKESQSQLQIKVLVAIVSSVLIVVTGVLIGYITHFFH